MHKNLRHNFFPLLILTGPFLLGPLQFESRWCRSLRPSHQRRCHLPPVLRGKRGRTGQTQSSSRNHSPLCKCLDWNLLKLPVSCSYQCNWKTGPEHHRTHCRMMLCGRLHQYLHHALSHRYKQVSNTPLVPRCSPSVREIGIDPGLGYHWGS